MFWDRNLIFQVFSAQQYELFSVLETWNGILQSFGAVLIATSAAVVFIL